ncbi:MAG: DEAD/DEAH box helicase [Spirochaetales bacterium]|nr:DEAD/DEAH box helicase [Spirochaetales bacterium]
MTDIFDFELKKLEHLFKTDILQQAGAYQVKDIIIREDTISGRVTDSSFVYRVKLIFRSNRFRTRCSCNSKEFCVHSAALFLAAREEMNTPLLDRLGKAFHDKWDTGRESLPVLYDKHFYDLENRFKAAFTATHKSTAKDEKRYRLAFTIIDSFKTLKIKAIMVYIKKNGGYGRTLSYSKGNVTEPVPDREQILLTSLLMGKHVVLESDLSNHLHYLIHNQVFMYDMNINQPIRMERIFFIEIHFEMDNLIFHEDFTFSPYFRLYNDEKKLLMDKVTRHCLHADNGYIYVYDEKNCTLFYWFDYTLCNIISAIKNIADYYYPADIKMISEYIEKNCPDRCSISFPYERVVITTPHPEIILKIDSFPGNNIPDILVEDAPGNSILDFDRRKGNPVAGKNSRDRLFITFHFAYNQEEVNYNYSKKIIIDAGSVYKPELVLIKRNKRYEEKCVTIIASFLSPVAEEVYEGFWSPESGLVLKTSIESFLKDYGLVLIDRGVSIKIRNKKLSSHMLLVFKVKTGIDWFDIHTKALDRKGTARDITIDPSLLPRGIIQAGDDYVFISREDAEKLTRFMESGMGKDGRMKTHKANFFLLETIYNQVANKEDEFEQYALIGKKLKEYNEIEHQKQPEGFKGTLREYQKAGYDWLYLLYSCKLNGCLADDMGLGKTIQTLCLLQRLKELDKFYTCLLVLPVVTISNWEQEIKRFTPGMSVIRHTGSRRTKDIFELMKYDLILVSYQTLRNDIKFFTGEEFFYIILDESQYVKNAATQTFKAVRLLKAEHILSLTGTPIENNLYELWAQMNILNPGLLGGIYEFRQMFINPVERSKDGGVKEKEYLRKITYPFILRRKKTDVLKDLPPKEVIIHYSEMGIQQKKIYATIKAYYRQRILAIMDERGKSGAIAIFAAILKVRQIALFPDLVSEEYNGVESCKFESAKLLIEEICAENHKILIFSQFVQVLNRFKAYFDSKGYEYSWITGQTKNRDNEIKRFQNDSTINLFLLSLKAGGTGINLTAADYVLLYDPWWNPAVEQQAMDRSHRIGQTGKVTVYKMIVKDTIEEKMLKLQENKQKMVDELITAEDGFYKSLGEDDLKELFM